PPWPPGSWGRRSYGDEASRPRVVTTIAPHAPAPLTPPEAPRRPRSPVPGGHAGWLRPHRDREWTPGAAGVDRVPGEPRARTRPGRRADHRGPQPGASDPQPGDLPRRSGPGP